MAANPFDRFDTATNPFDQFDAPDSGSGIGSELYRGFTQGLLGGARQLNVAAGALVPDDSRLGRHLAGNVNLFAMGEQDFQRPADVSAMPWYSPTRVAGGVGQAAASMLPGLMVGGGLAGFGLKGLGTLAGGAMAGFQEAEPFYRQMIEEGVPEDEARTRAGIAAPVIGGLNMIGLGRILGRAPGRLLTGAIEAGTEIAEEPVQSLFAGKGLGEAGRATVEGAKEVGPASFILGSLLGGGSSPTPDVDRNAARERLQGLMEGAEPQAAPTPQATPEAAQGGLYAPAPQAMEGAQEPTAPFASRPAPVWFSQAQRLVEQAGAPRATGEQWLGYLRNKGAKPEELAWTGADEWLREQKGAVTKQDLSEYLRSHRVEVTEVLKSEVVQPGRGAGQDIPKFANWQLPGGENYRELLLTIPGNSFTGGHYDEPGIVAHVRFNDRMSVDPTPNSMQPGGSEAGANSLTAQAKLLTDLVKRRAFLAKGLSALDVENRKAVQSSVVAAVSNDEIRRGVIQSIPVEVVNDLARFELTPEQFLNDSAMLSDSLSGNPNAAVRLSVSAERGLVQTVARLAAKRVAMSPDLAGVTGDNRTAPSTRDSHAGKRTLFIEEIQSDLHQKGRKEGYQDQQARAAFDAYGKELAAKYGLNPLHNLAMYSGIKNMDPAEVAKYEELQLAAYPYGRADAVPDAPFKTTWPDLALKRMIRWAAENGYDRIAWTPGEVQADRYDLSKHIRRLEWAYQTLGGRDHVSLDATLTRDQGGTTQSLGVVERNKLADTVGKDAAKRIGDEISSGKTEGTLSGLDLKVGGEGMRGFYDKILVDAANKLGKRFGAKVGRTGISAMDRKVEVEKNGNQWRVLEIYPDGQRIIFATLPSEARAKSAAAGLVKAIGERDTNAHSLDITPQMRESVMQGQPLMRAPEGWQIAETDVPRQAFDLDNTVRPIIAKWGPNAPNLKVAPTGRQLPPNLLRQLGPNVLGAYDPATQTVWLVENNITSPTMALRVLRHESVGHYGMMHLLGERWNTVVKQTQALAKTDPVIREIAGDVAAAYANESADIQAMETIAKLAERNPQHTLVQRMVAWLREAFRKFGINLNLTTNDLIGLLRKAEQFNQRGAAQGGAMAARTPENEAYVGLHTAPDNESGDPAFNITRNVYPEDVYGPLGAQYYGHFGGNDSLDLESFGIVWRLRHHPDHQVRIYRAVPKELSKVKINSGDWVTINRRYARQHGDMQFDGKFRVISKLVHARDIFTNGDSIHEWGYDPQPFVPYGERAYEDLPQHIRKMRERIAEANKNEPLAARPEGMSRTGAPATGTAAPQAPVPSQIEVGGGTYTTAPFRGMDESVQRALLDVLEMQEDRVATERGNEGQPVDWAQTGSEAEALLQTSFGKTFNELVNRVPRSAANTAKLEAFARIVNASGKALRAAADQYARTMSAEDLARLVAAREQAGLALAPFMGYRTEAGRALNILKKVQADFQDAQAIFEAIGNGGEEAMRDFARRIRNAGSVDEALQITRASYAPTLWDQWFEYWINGLLSGPWTHAVNLTSNALFTALEGGTEFATSLVSPHVSTRAVKARLAGMLAGRNLAIGNALKAFRTEEPVLTPRAQVETERHRAIPGKLGRAVRIPGRLLTAEDEFNKAIVYTGELYRIAMDRALKESPQDPHSVMPQILAGLATDKAAQADAKRYAERLTFQTELGTFGRTATRLLNASKVGRMIVPFVRTPTNILKRAMEYTPVGLAMSPVREAIKAGGREGALAKGRLVMGSAIMGSVMAAVVQGLVTGAGPDDPREKALWMRTGRKPYSFRVGDQWVRYNRFEPLGMLFGVAADMAEIGGAIPDKDLGDLGVMLASSVALNLGDKTFLRGIIDFSQAYSDPKRYGEDWAAGMAGTALPNVLAQGARAMDPYLRDARGIVDKFRARVPGVRESLPAKRDIAGEPIERSLVEPLAATQERNDPLAEAMLKAGAFKGAPSRKLRLSGLDYEFTPEEYEQYSAFVQQARWRVMSPIAASPQFQALLRNDRLKAKDALEELWDKIGREARDVWLARHPEVVRKALSQSPRERGSRYAQ